MEYLIDGLFRVLDPRAVLAIVLLCFELLQETETRRSGRVPRSAVLGHAETLLAAMRHLITKEGCAVYFLHTGAAVKRREAGWDAICENRMLQCGALACAKHHQA